VLTRGLRTIRFASAGWFREVSLVGAELPLTLDAAVASGR
jgi:hypothetical protein